MCTLQSCIQQRKKEEGKGKMSKRYVVTDNVSVAIFNNTEETGVICAIFPDKSIKYVVETIEKEYSDKTFFNTIFTAYKKGDVIERELEDYEKEMLNFRILEERTIEESLRIKDGTVNEI